jgi:hypothetical protein
LANIIKDFGIDMTANSAKGRSSQDMVVGDSVVSFVNRNVTPYATEVGAPNFDLVPVQSHKDLMVNAARRHAQQEYDRIMDLVAVLQTQAEDIRRRLDLTDQVAAARYNMVLYSGAQYWLVRDQQRGNTLLTPLGPEDWSTGAPAHYEYLAHIEWLGDNTWREVA